MVGFFYCQSRETLNDLLMGHEEDDGENSVGFCPATRLQTEFILRGWDYCYNQEAIN